ncbi:MAG: HlyD family efflux transporter periplasmic adaptor subunit [Armatimonadetes bacterium]|nr:HlyD family efflux transporter periplasmic adaptor subunit [Armatimonadota bacterium]
MKRQDLVGYSFFDGRLLVPEGARATAYAPYDTKVASLVTGIGKLVRRGDPIIRLEVPGADAATTAAKSNVDAARADYSAQKGSSSDPLHEAQRALAEAQASEKAARDTVANGGQADIEYAAQVRMDAQAVLKQVQQELRDTLQPSKDALRRASETLVSARADAAKGVVRAPISGTVVWLEAQPGMAVTGKQLLATVINFDVVRVQGLVPAELKDLVAKNSRVIIAMSGPNSDPFDGVVLDVTVVPPVEGKTGPGYLASIRFLAPRAIAQPVLSVKRIGVRTGSLKGVLVVPVGALTTKDGKSTVNVQSGETWVVTEVQTGMTDGALVEIKSGLAEGAVVRVISEE